jgi:hypothetical protein
MARAAFDTDRIACFAATRAELHGALPGWRVPLPAPIERMGKNPFTGKPMILKTRDPGPDRPVALPASLPFEHVLLPSVEDWESRYVALDLTLAGDDGCAPDHFSDSGALVDIMIERGLYDYALFGDVLQEHWVLAVPQRLVAMLNSLADDSLGVFLTSWNLRSPSPSTLDDLRDLWTLARSANAQQREMFLWLVPPPHR